jgi:hypothetical protein
MGVLDDAIREHIELKRRHGADPGEVERLEKEAFGPISREGLAPPPAAGPSADSLRDEPDDGDGFTEQDLLTDDQPHTSGAADMGHGLGTEYPANPYAPPPMEGESGGEPGAPADDPPEPPQDQGDPPATHADDRSGLFDDPAGGTGSSSASSEAGAVSARDWGEEDWDAPPAREVDQPTQSYSLEDLEALRREEEAAAADPDVVPADGETHDELEGTPDFLEETPEHDRLWFEQKPPKDFDF